MEYPIRNLLKTSWFFRQNQGDNTFYFETNGLFEINDGTQVYQSNEFIESFYSESKNVLFFYDEYRKSFKIKFLKDENYLQKYGDIYLENFIENNDFYLDSELITTQNIEKQTGQEFNKIDYLLNFWNNFFIELNSGKKIYIIGNYFFIEDYPNNNINNLQGFKKDIIITKIYNDLENPTYFFDDKSFVPNIENNNFYGTIINQIQINLSEILNINNKKVTKEEWENWYMNNTGN